MITTGWDSNGVGGISGVGRKSDGAYWLTPSSVVDNSWIMNDSRDPRWRRVVGRPIDLRPTGRFTEVYHTR